MKSTRKLTLSGLFLAIGLLLPFLTGQIPNIGKMLLPMHIPVLLCGFMCGWPYGLIVGLIMPVLRSMIFGMPSMFPTALAMAFELAAYGFMTGLLHKLLPKKIAFIFVTLVSSMIFGRIIWGGVSYILYTLSGSAFTWPVFMGGAFLNAIPGIAIQIIIIPGLIIALSRARLMDNA